MSASFVTCWVTIALKKMKSTFVVLIGLCLAALSQAAISHADRGDPQAVIEKGIPYAEREIARIATEVANSRPFFQEDYGRIEVSARYDIANGTLFLDPGSRLGPISGYPEIEDLHTIVDQEIGPITELLPNYDHTVWLYGGRDLYHWFPQDRTASDLKPARIGAPKIASSVLVSAGHGYYFHHDYKDWRAQRDSSNGVLEDQITPVLSDVLGWELMTHGTEVTYSRIDEPRNHDPSQQPYQMVAARYQLAELLSFRPDIWHSLPTATDGLREYREDIRSRPLYANFLGVDEVIHLHTNAGDRTSSRGASVIVQEKKPESERLGNLVLCYMKEQIHGIPAYADFPVAPAVLKLDKGENRLATMPSIIVEAAFHTSPQDAELLKDARFRAVAMRGVAKGYRLYKKNEKCEEFAMSSPKESSGVAGQVVRIPIVFSGNPDFPVAMTVVEKDCSAVYCHRATTVFYSKEDYAGYTHSFLCNGGDSFRDTAVLVAKAHDKNEIETPEMVHTVRCMPKGVREGRDAMVVDS